MKNKKTIKKLFEAVERDFYYSLGNNKEYNEISHKIGQNEELLKNYLNKEQFKIYNNLSDYQAELESVEIEESFINGFKTAYDLYRDTL